MSTQLTVQQKQAKILAVIDEPERFKPLLPDNMDVAKFVAVIKRGLQQNPNLITADTASLILSCQNAAQDGLLPDGREGALVMYGQKVQWQPMIGGIRKKLADVGFDLRADIVYSNDSFDYDLGDDPRITHKAPKLGEPRGEMIGAYAIATDEGGNKYREVMSKDQIMAVAAVSRSGNGGPWKGPFASEMWRKTVARRLAKSLPIGSAEQAERVAGLFQRDDERNFAFDKEPAGPSETARSVHDAARAQAAAKPAPDDDAIDAQFTDANTQETANEDDDPPF